MTTAQCLAALKKERKVRADQHAFEPPKEYIEYIKDHCFDVEYVNESLNAI